MHATNLSGHIKERRQVSRWWGCGFWPVGGAPVTVISPAWLFSSDEYTSRSGKARNNDADLEFISRHRWERIFFLFFCNGNLCLLSLILESFAPSFYNLIPIFSSHCMYMFIKWCRIFMRACCNWFRRIKKKKSVYTCKCRFSFLKSLIESKIFKFLHNVEM